MVYSAVFTAQTVVSWSPEPPSMLMQLCNYVDQKGLAAMTSIQLAGVAPEVNLRTTQVKKHTKGSTLALKPRSDVNRSPKQEYQWLHERTYVLQNLFKKRKKKLNQIRLPDGVSGVS